MGDFGVTTEQSVAWRSIAKIKDEEFELLLSEGERLDTQDKMLDFNRRGMLRKGEGFVYVVECAGYYKIGKSTKPIKRLNTMRSNNPLDINVIITEKFVDYGEIEKYLHKRYKGKLHRQEWYEFNKQDVEDIRNYIKDKKR